MDSGIERTLSKFANNTKLCGVVDMLEGREAIQRDLDRLERLGREWIESSSKEKDFGMLVDKKLNVTWECALTAQKASYILGCIKRSVASWSRKVILPLCSHKTPPGVLGPALESSAQEGHGPVGAGPERATKMIRELEYLSYEDRLRELGLFSLEKRRLQQDLIATFQSLKGATGETGTDFLAGSGAIGRGVMVLN
ncbi:hypothetical protein llap_6296 [Limosa lapponica baueri]|uniref:Rna-directed dna polymerase from mobile element jockey-like n=1 Tax=Limosa lapponica baueri TaxID=1758121 RepID=A0A2I0UBI8_LIMLA|nr:hypothetical protein llap_6296 [Limosa lapponica baueri]